MPIGRRVSPRAERVCPLGSGPVRTDDVIIDWSTAEVTSQHGSLQLDVQLVPEPDSYWKNAFSRIAERRHEEVRDDPHGWFTNMPSSDWLNVQRVAVGQEDETRAALEEMIKAANDGAARDRVEEAKKRAGEERESKEREQAVRDMTDRFRSG